ncbi:ornithine carbamoyltransferase [Alkalilimnicola ehrlichii MLHE-1]|uniref:Ornithine carbamoyltransferase n=1 Tax=Alkalilimnicola ehrlichii (strain ATCC BAA-1101 / DSM 17681 / MLHE-1) TaxID=187272 RepID=Q0A9N4_ALKEH|nr:ornithine carbamoyltransferase [Alkalilimnicola ehrlichii]ABI56453.1 ornithine carbamoyltransferase [Alkalilimnicola ehrlichii MLHE-1]
MHPRHFLTLLDFTPDELRRVIHRASELKHIRDQGQLHEPLRGKVLGMVFEKSSTRTRVAFEAGMNQLGGSAIFLSPRDTQLGRGEPVEDTARVLSRMVDIIMIRTYGHEVLERFAEYSRVPVINGLSDRFHPCQLLADIQAYEAHRGSIQGRTVAWVGDGNNMCHSWINAARQLDFQLRIAVPEGYDPDPDLIHAGGDRVSVHRDPREAVEGVHLVTTDVWASMGQEEEAKARMKAFSGFCVDDALMGLAAKDAVFMHCLPAHRGEEVSASVIDGPQSVVWDEAENRLHAHKALMEFLLLAQE